VKHGVIDEKDIAAMFIMTTHNLPLNFLIDQLREDIAEITFIGIQPEVVAFYYPISAAVKQAVTVLHQRLLHWDDNGGYPQLEVTNV
jgi:hydrogenase 3 maturation protease